MKGRRVYLHVKYWPHDDTYHLEGFPHRQSFDPWHGMVMDPQRPPRPGRPELVRSATLLPGGDPLEVSWKGNGILLRGLPRRPPDPYLNVIMLEL